jgi:oligopeptide transport system permease protein
MVWRRFTRNFRAVACGLGLAAILAGCFLLPVLAPDRYRQQHLDRRYAPPSWSYPFGQDELGRDLLSRMLRGGQVSFLVGLSATVLSTVIGVLYGAFSGWAGGRVDAMLMRVADIVYGLPFMFIVIIVMAMFESRSLVIVFAVLGLFTWPTMARIVRGQVLSLKEKEFVEAARALGLGPARILLRHILPNTVGPVIVYATLMVPSIMLQESFLSFLGLGVTEPLTSWGTLLSEGRVVLAGGQIRNAPWWLLVFPGGALALTLYCLNTVGDALRDAFDVEARE